MKDLFRQLKYLQSIAPGLFILLLAPHAYAHAGIGPRNGWLDASINAPVGQD